MTWSAFVVVSAIAFVTGGLLGFALRATLSPIYDRPAPAAPRRTAVLFPPEAGDTVCHDAQLEVWASEVLDDVSPYIREDIDYDEAVALRRGMKRRVRTIVLTAFTRHQDLAEAVFQRGGDRDRA